MYILGYLCLYSPLHPPMARAAISRSFFVFNNSPSSLSFCKRIHFHLLSSPFPSLSLAKLPSNPTYPLSPLTNPTSVLFLYATKQDTHFTKSFTTSSSPSCDGGKEESSSTPKKRNTMVNFSLSDSDSDSDSEDSGKITTMAKKEIDKSKLPPPYDPFNKKPAIEKPKDPKNLQEVFHNMRSDGMFNSAVKMFDALSKDGLTHEALELFAKIKDKGHMPDVVAHTAVIEAYADAGQGKELLRAYRRMLACGVLPNAYTYAVTIRGLAACGDKKLLDEGKKCLLEMVGRGMRPNAKTCVALFEALAMEGKGEEEEGREVMEVMREKGVVPDEKDVREVLKEKRGPVWRSVMSMLFNK